MKVPKEDNVKNTLTDNQNQMNESPTNSGQPSTDETHCNVGTSPPPVSESNNGPYVLRWFRLIDLQPNNTLYYAGVYVPISIPPPIDFEMTNHGMEGINVDGYEEENFGNLINALDNLNLTQQDQEMDTKTEEVVLPDYVDEDELTTDATWKALSLMPVHNEDEFISETIWQDLLVTPEDFDDDELAPHNILRKLNNFNSLDTPASDLSSDEELSSTTDSSSDEAA